MKNSYIAPNQPWRFIQENGILAALITVAGAIFAVILKYLLDANAPSAKNITTQSSNSTEKTHEDAKEDSEKESTEIEEKMFSAIHNEDLPSESAEGEMASSEVDVEQLEDDNESSSTDLNDESTSDAALPVSKLEISSNTPIHIVHSKIPDEFGLAMKLHSDLYNQFNITIGIPGKETQEEARLRIQGAELVLLVIDSKATNSEDIVNEAMYAGSSLNTKIIPVVIDNTSDSAIPKQFKAYVKYSHPIYFSSGDYAKGLKTIKNRLDDLV